MPALEPASSFFVGNPPQGASYAGPILQFAQLSQLPDDYFQGQQRARTLSLQQPVIDPNTGQPTTDPRAILAAANQRGGLETALQVLPQAQRQQFLDSLQTQNDQPGSPGPAINPRAANPNAAGPGNLRLPGQNPSVAPQGSYPTMDMQGDGTANNPYRPRSMSDFQEIENGSYFVSSKGNVVLKGAQPDNAIAQSPNAVSDTEESHQRT